MFIKQWERKEARRGKERTEDERGNKKLAQMENNRRVHRLSYLKLELIADVCPVEVWS